MASNFSPISPIDVNNDSGVVPIQSSSMINRDDATTTRLHLYDPNAAVRRPSINNSNKRPHGQYAHQDKINFARVNNFDLEGKETARRRKNKIHRMQVQSYAITSCTNVSKQTLLDGILQEFDLTDIQYVCVAREMSPTTNRPHLHVQIILNRAVNKHGFFLDKYSDGDFVEHGTFDRPDAQQNGMGSSAPTRPSVGAINTGMASPQLPPAKRKTVRAQAEERRQQKDVIADTALTIAETSVDKAMGFTRQVLPYEFLSRSENFQKSFTYVNKEAKGQHKRVEVEEFCWDISFPDCTPALHAAVTEWITNNFWNPNRPQCLVLIGLTGTGKTSFAKSLPGPYCYFKGRWSLDLWDDQARYLIFDDIPWDKFEDLNFPSKKDLLSANGAVSCTDKYKPTVTIKVKVPAIVLLNPGDEGSLTAPAVTQKERQHADYWSKRAVVYQMGPDEYFYKSTTSGVVASHETRQPLGHPDEFIDAQRRWLEARDRRRAAAATTVPPPPPPTATTNSQQEQPSSMVNSSNADQSDDNEYSYKRNVKSSDSTSENSTDSPMSIDELRLGELDEFDPMIEHNKILSNISF
ncbi:unnamed protein product [Adineta steineri]|uniref:Replication-associated protein n=1 Tax=Adineta steineri TaxID=433720 RepID=A0A819QST9_9BILA|nr:unnamed protein product [Adineta steineri]